MFFFQTKLSILTTQIRLNMDLLCQDVFLYHYCISLFQHQQLAIPAFDIGSAALHFFQSRRFTKKWSNCRTKACALHPLGLCEYTLVSRKKTYCQHLSYKLPMTFRILPYALNLGFWIFDMWNFQHLCQLLCFDSNLLEGYCFHVTCCCSLCFQPVCLCIVNRLWNSLETWTHLPLCDMPCLYKKVCPILQFPSSVVATNFGLSRCLLLVIYLNLQSESLAQERNSKSGGPGHAQLKASWPWLGNKTVSPTCSKLRMDSNIHSQPPNHAPCWWKMYLTRWGRYLVPRIMSHLGYPFVRWRPEGLYRLTNGIDEQKSVEKWKPQEANLSSGFCSLWTASLLVRHLKEGRVWWLRLTAKGTAINTSIL